MYSFYAFLSRMKYIGRWGLMKSLQPENLAEHSLQTAMLAHALASIENVVFGGSVDANLAGMIAVFHDSSEVITGDMPTPIKYFSEDISHAYKEVEKNAEEKLLGLLPDELCENLSALVQPEKNSREYLLAKTADKLSALIKCIEEIRSHNDEFRSALASISENLENAKQEIPALAYFMDNFLAAYYKNLDELL